MPPEDEPGAVRFGGAPRDQLLPSLGDEGGASLAGAVATPSTARVGDQVTIDAAETGADVCGGLVVLYELTGDGERETGAAIADASGVLVWTTAPPGIPRTLPPCRPDPAPLSVVFTVPPVPPGNYSVCLTRDSAACAELTVAP